MKNGGHFLLAVTGGVSFGLTNARAQPLFAGLSDPSGAYSLSEAEGVSSDGLIVIANGKEGLHFCAFRWTVEDGAVAIEPHRATHAHGMSADGSVITGYANPDQGSETGFYWSERDGCVFPEPPPGAKDVVGWAASGDGSVLALTADPGWRLVRWTADEGCVLLPEGPLDPVYAIPQGMSANGQVIVGYTQNQAFRWTAEEGMIGLGDLDDGKLNSSASAVNADGSVIVGFGTLPGAKSASRWIFAGMAYIGSRWRRT